MVSVENKEKMVFQLSSKKVKMVPIALNDSGISQSFDLNIPGILASEGLILFQVKPGKERNIVAEKILRKFGSEHQKAKPFDISRGALRQAEHQKAKLFGDYYLGFGDSNHLTNDVTNKLWETIQKTNSFGEKKEPDNKSSSPFNDALDYVSFSIAAGEEIAERFLRKMKGYSQLSQFMKIVMGKKAPIDYATQFGSLIRLDGEKSFMETMDLIGSANEIIRFLTTRGLADFISLTHLHSHMKADEISRISRSVGGVENLIMIMRYLNPDGIEKDNHVHTFHDLVKADGIDMICELFSSDGHLRIVKELGHLCLHMGSTSMILCVTIFNGSQKLVSFMDKIGGVHEMVEFMKIYSPMKLTLLSFLHGPDMLAENYMSLHSNEELPRS